MVNFIKYFALGAELYDNKSMIVDYIALIGIFTS